jgi:DNA-binding IclR family transcriptional regulator
MKKQKIVNCIIKAVDILRNLSEGVDRISDITERLHLSKSTAHRLLKTLEMSELVTRDPIARRYFLGPLIFKIASKPLMAHKNLIVCSFEEMKYLRDLSRETVVLHIQVGLERICLEEIQSLENLKYTAGKGSVAPIYTGSAGKVLLSELRDDELQFLLKNLRLVPIGPNTITGKKVLLNELEKVRKKGYATSFGERILGSASIAVPIKNYICPVSLGILGPSNRFLLKKMMDILKDHRPECFFIKAITGKERRKSREKMRKPKEIGRETKM